jgi:hypothetical protein
MISLSIVCLFGVYNDLYFGTTIKLRYYCLKEKIWKINGKNPEKTLKKILSRIDQFISRNFVVKMTT